MRAINDYALTSGVLRKARHTPTSPRTARARTGPPRHRRTTAHRRSSTSPPAPPRRARPPESTLLGVGSSTGTVTTTSSACSRLEGSAPTAHPPSTATTATSPMVVFMPDQPAIGIPHTKFLETRLSSPSTTTPRRQMTTSRRVRGVRRRRGRKRRRLVEYSVHSDHGGDGRCAPRHARLLRVGWLECRRAIRLPSDPAGDPGFEVCRNQDDSSHLERHASSRASDQEREGYGNRHKRSPQTARSRSSMEAART